MIKTTIYAYISKESAYKKGKQIGLSKGALEMFIHFNEVELVIEVEDSGMVSRVKAVEI